MNSAKQSSTDIKFDIKENGRLNIDDYDICRLLNNLVDNSINAAKLTQENKSFVSIDIERDEVVIRTENKFDKAAKKPKQNDGKHGFGTKIIRDIVKKYGGKYSVEILGDDYVTVTTMKNREAK